MHNSTYTASDPTQTRSFSLEEMIAAIQKMRDLPPIDRSSICVRESMAAELQKLLIELPGPIARGTPVFLAPDRRFKDGVNACSEHELLPDFSVNSFRA